MASDSTYEGLYKGVLLYAPKCPLPLAQKFVNDAYSRVLGMCTHPETYAETSIFIPAQYQDGTITVTNGSTTVTGASTAWTSAMEGRQLLVNNVSPFYDILTVGGAGTMTLGSPYIGEDDSGVSYTIAQTYVSMPSDFLSFRSVLDPVNNWRLHTNLFTQAQIDLMDAQRTYAATPWVLARCKPLNPGTSTETLRYELWPRSSGVKTYPVRYNRKPALLSANSDRPLFPVRGDTVLEGALAALALWPGTSDAPNAYYDIQLSREHERRFLTKVQQTEIELQAGAQTWISYPGEGAPMAPIDAAFMQAHAIPF